jgi:hypothetical protein
MPELDNKAGGGEGGVVEGPSVPFLRYISISYW